MKRKMAEDLDVLLDETLTLCETPPVPRRHPNRVVKQYNKPLPPTPTQKSEMEMRGPPMFHFGEQTELVPKPLFNRSNSLPSRSTRPSLPSRPSEPFQFNADDIVKSPTPLFGRRNTLPSKVRRAVAAERKPSPLSRREDAPSSAPTHTTPKEPTSPALPRKEPNANTKTTPNPKSNSGKAPYATPQRYPGVRVVDIKRPSPLSGKGSARRPGPTRFTPAEPVSPIVLSPVISNSNSSVASSPSPSVFSDSASFCPSSPSTPATSPPSSPTTHARSLSYFAPSHWTIKPSPSPIYVPRQKLRRKDSPRMETLRTLRAKESDAMLQKEYDQHWEEYRNKLSLMTGGLFSAERL